MSIHTAPEIQQGIRQSFAQLIDWVRAQPAEKFDKGPEGRWTMGQHIEHLISSAKPLNQGLRVPKLAIKGMFGTNNREERSYDGVIARYKEKLTQGGQATGKYVPGAVEIARKDSLLESLEKEGERLAKAMEKWNEGQLSKYLLPHPLLGKVTVREMMFFTVYHMQHHLEIMQREAAQ